jgi:AraC family transcriptional activator of pobA
MANAQPYHIKTITEYHRITGLPKPEHPLISVVNFEDITPPGGNAPMGIVFDFYSISLKRNFNAKVKYIYGQQSYDFDEGIMFFISPGQKFSVESEGDYKPSGWMLLIHPDFLWKTVLVEKIKQYEYFSYAVHEALHLSDKEETMAMGIIQNIAQEYHSNIDKFSQDVIVAQIDLLLTYAERFYQRQFITRKISNHTVLSQLEEVLEQSFKEESLQKKGLPSVQSIADSLNLSPNYLSSLLKIHTGQSTQQHIHGRLIEKAKEKLSDTDFSVSEIAYQLGFEYPQSFNKLFKNKTNLSPLEFRDSIN